MDFKSCDVCTKHMPGSLNERRKLRRMSPSHLFINVSAAGSGSPTCSDRTKGARRPKVLGAEVRAPQYHAVFCRAFKKMIHKMFLS